MAFFTTIINNQMTATTCWVHFLIQTPTNQDKPVSPTKFHSIIDTYKLTLLRPPVQQKTGGST
ncbi:hypothetical protein D1831_07325 [Lactiplantibacillus garii]|uniref:Uncharacterized protein n=1 Tax=Lactiplantibacillus garii TaxID=2306423 RepID=A0A426D7A2_9LACO|nr:hypothetical protein D1831_07325 [Lactiplantibacillus garii]